MAQTEHLPIYKSTYDLCLSLGLIVQHFSRYHKYALRVDLHGGARHTAQVALQPQTPENLREAFLSVLRFRKFPAIGGSLLPDKSPDRGSTEAELSGESRLTQTLSR